MTPGLKGAAAALAALAAGSAQAGSPAPLRVMSLNLCTDQLVLALLPPERIASVTWLSRDPESSTMATAARRVRVNYGRAEEVVRDRPDLVVAGSFSTPETRLLLKKLHFHMIEVDEADSFADIRRITRQVAAAVGQPARGEALLTRMDARLAELARDPGPPLRVAAWDGAGFSARPGSLYDTVLKTAGARNVADERGVFGSGSPGVETLLAAAPTLLVRTGARGQPSRRTDVAYHPLVRRWWADRTVIVPQAYTACGTPMSAEAARLLRDQLRAAAHRNPGPPAFALPGHAAR